MLEKCPNKFEDCPYKDQKPRKALRRVEDTGCYSDVHHTKFPARIYQTPIEKAYRELPENKEQTCRWLHDLIHLEESPDKPDLIFMLEALKQTIQETADV